MFRLYAGAARAAALLNFTGLGGAGPEPGGNGLSVWRPGFTGGCAADEAEGTSSRAVPNSGASRRTPHHVTRQPRRPRWAPSFDEPREMTMKNGDRVVQMIPAAGYYAAYQDGDEITYNPVAAWIVVEDQQGRQRVDGVDPSGGNWDGSPCSYAKNFVEFVYRDERERRR